MSTGLVDCHLHLQDYDEGTDIEAVIARAASVGVTHFVCNGEGEHDWRKVADLASAHPNVIPCFGLHPWMLDDRSAGWLGALESYLLDTPSGVGEIGLDHLHEPVHPDQEEVFRAQLSLARRLHRPAMIHCVRAYGMLMDVLRDEPPLPAGFMVHAYGGPAELVGELVGMGAYLSFAGNVLREHHERGRKSLLAMPRDRLLLETDSPALLPPTRFRTEIVPRSGGDYNHLANLPSVLAGIASVLGDDESSLRRTLWENARRFLSPIRSLP